ncbi:hypothetical protein L7F22_007345 [Adiantum nelumboides]|nr:hypothetical protein [Adiantum nelumboides]
MAVWNCNGSLWTHPGRLEEVMEDKDIVLLTETHESPERGLPKIQSYVWESSHRKCTCHHTSRDKEARFIWIRMELHEGSFIYIALCYFAASGSRFAIVSGDTVGDDTKAQERDGKTEGETLSPYACLTEGIREYSSLGEVFLMGDFNGQTQSRQCETYDFEDSELLDPLDEARVERTSADTIVSTPYGRHLLRNYSLYIFIGVYDIMMHAKEYGFENTNTTQALEIIVCIARKYEGWITCFMPYKFWDAIHSSKRVNYLTSLLLWNDIACSPYSVQNLASCINIEGSSFTSKK